MCIQGPRHLAHLALLSQVHWQGAGWEVKQSGLNLAPYGVPLPHTVALSTIPQPLLPSPLILIQVNTAKITLCLPTQLACTLYTATVLTIRSKFSTQFLLLWLPSCLLTLLKNQTTSHTRQASSPKYFKIFYPEFKLPQFIWHFLHSRKH